MFHQRSKLSLSYLLAKLLAPVRLYAFDPKDPDTAAAIAAAVEEAVSGLTSKNAELLKEVKTLKKGSRETTDNSAEMERLEADNERLTAELAKTSKELKAASKAVEENSTALASERGYTERLLVDNGLSAALAAHGVTNPAHAKAAAALIRSTSKIEVAADGDTRTATVGGKALGDFVKEWAGSEDGKHFVTAPGNSGGGAPGSQGGGQHKPAGNFGGTREERIAAIRAQHGDKLAQ